MHRSNFVFVVLGALAVASSGRQSSADTLTTLTSFNGTNGDQPEGGLTLSGSALYGTTKYGGANSDGTVFSIPVTGSTPTTLLSFNGTDGAYPNGSLTLSADGSTLYGTTTEYAGGNGTVFSIPVTGGTPTVLASFNGTDGANPYGSLTLSADGSTLYGMTLAGGANGEGNVFSVPVAGGTPTDLLDFNGTTGAYPFGSLTLSADGSTLYGMTAGGGANSDGTVFSIPVTGGTPTVLASFNGADGAGPRGDLTLVGSTLYGTAELGGVDGIGTIFSIPVTGGTPTVLASFNGTDGKYPWNDLTLVGSKLYGTTEQGGASHNAGTIFSIPLTGGTLTTVFSFDSTNGGYPDGSLTLSGSTLYGTTSLGGANDYGTVFALATPEPSSAVLLGLGAIGSGAMALRRTRRK